MEKLRILSRGGAWATRKKKYGWYGGEWFISWGSGVNQRRQRQPTPVLLPGKSHEQRSLVGCSPRGQEESDMTEQLHFHFSLSSIGGGNGNPLQSSCLENHARGEPGGLLSMGSHRVGHDWSNLATAAAGVDGKEWEVWLYEKSGGRLVMNFTLWLS